VVLEVVEHTGVLELTLARPEALNAFTVEMHEQLAAALKRARADEIRAVVVTGAGRAFSAGQDLDEVRTSDLTPGARLQRHYNPNIRALVALEKPVIAAVNGVAAGAGASLALACDIRIASAKASFVPAFVAIGLVPDTGMTWFAVKQLGYARALQWVTTNRRLGAAEAYEWGLVNEVVEPETVLDRARELASELAAQPGEAVAMTKRLLRRALTSTLEEQLELERQLQQVASEHPAYAESVAAFLNKQPAQPARSSPPGSAG
jgi:2-(1,2-epoxy-1,2-dihydrophenyl)acetyl-CoA isomerase